MIKGLEGLEVDRMNETEFEEAAMKVALEMSERQALMRCYKIPPDIIYESMRSQREVFLKDGYSLVLKEKTSKGKSSQKVVGASFANRLYDV